MKTLPVSTDDASPHQCDPSRASSFRSVADSLQAVACDNKTTEKPSTTCGALQGGHRTSIRPSSTLPLDRTSLDSSASTSSPPQLPLQNQELLPPPVNDATTQSHYVTEAAATHVTKEQYRGRLVEDADRHRVCPVTEKEVPFSVQPRHSPQGAAAAASPTARTGYQLRSLTSCGDSSALLESDEPSGKSFHAAKACPVSAFSSKLPDVEVSVATAGRKEATSAPLPHENPTHGEKQTGTRLSTVTTSSSASHEIVGTVPSTKKRPQTEQTTTIPRHPPHTQQHQQPPLQQQQQQQQQPPLQQQQPAAVQNREQCLVPDARHTFQPLQQHQVSEVGGSQPSLLPAQALPGLGHSECSSEHQPLLTGPLPAQGTASAPSLFAQAGRLDNGSAADRQAPPRVL
ncbi:unnamed protein product [Rangifer tarandus platyrhynchus]|uniref:Uncharacterized protein n=1 Tax=Rangifer tarandus platyrhynchus TaxID=3082113 RepID=A0ABN8XKL7_RANTA|nr:unnamed protein product [Rangifer tarandus platyrhynchus]